MPTFPDQIQEVKRKYVAPKRTSAIGFPLTKEQKIVKPSLFAPIILLLVAALGLSGCGAGGSTENAASTPFNEIDVVINDYEKLSNECLRLSKKHTTGDVSITVLLIVARKNFQDTAAKLQQAAGKMSPLQAKRVAAISAKTAPCLGP